MPTYKERRYNKNLIQAITSEDLDDVNNQDRVISQNITVSLAQSEDSEIVDCKNYRKLRIWGTSDQNQNLGLEYSHNGVNFTYVNQLIVQNLGGIYVYQIFLDNPPEYIRFGNKHNQPMNININCILSI
tara:strand:+ start:45 stop:431 length:387 start_codon:yes stop_codon:yes gene_type:complete